MQQPDSNKNSMKLYLGRAIQNFSRIKIHLCKSSELLYISNSFEKDDFFFFFVLESEKREGAQLLVITQQLVTSWHTSLSSKSHSYGGVAAGNGVWRDTAREGPQR